MENIFNKFTKKMSIDSEDDYYEDEVEQMEEEEQEVQPVSEPTYKPFVSKPTATTNANVVDMSSNIKAKVVIECPAKFDKDIEKIADHLINGNTLILNLEKIDEATEQRMLDFFSGVVYAQKGGIYAVSTKTYMLAPKNVSTEGHVQVIDKDPTTNNQG